MNIHDFEADIEDKIVARGKSYFTNGLISDIWSEHENCYFAVVAGSIPYDVEICFDEEGLILEHSCDCPYDWGEYCKHEVAVLLALREHLAQNTALKQQGHKQGLRAMLSRQSKDELVELLCKLAREYDLQEEVVYHLGNDDGEHCFYEK